MSMICSDVVQHEPIVSVNRNKDNYKQYRRRLCYLTQNIHHDAVSGWLMMASLFIIVFVSIHTNDRFMLYYITTYHTHEITIIRLYSLRPQNEVNCFFV
jgi:hypothetical protein